MLYRQIVGFFLSKLKRYIITKFQLARAFAFSLSGIVVGRGCRFGRHVRLSNRYRIEVGDKSIIDNYRYLKCGHSKEELKRKFISIGCNTWMGSNTFIEANYSVKIGSNVLIANSCFISDSKHKYDDINILIKDQGVIHQEVVINDDVWIGTKCIILQGVTIGRGAIVAGNSLVNKDVEPYTIVGGSPAHFIKTR